MAPHMIHQTGLPGLLDVPEGLQRPPGIPGLLGAAMGVPDVTGEAVSRRKAEIGGDELIGVLQQRALPHHGTAAADGHGQPLVRVERHRVGALQP